MVQLFSTMPPTLHKKTAAFSFGKTITPAQTLMKGSFQTFYNAFLSLMIFVDTSTTPQKNAMNVA